MAHERIARMLERRPPQGRFRDQLFWLVDVVYACKASGDGELLRHARLVEEALGSLGQYLETGDTVALDQATSRVEQFARDALRAEPAQTEPPAGHVDRLTQLAVAALDVLLLVFVVLMATRPGA